ncbi:MAG TPA: hypothetical protein PLS50_06225, partial [Candidatus Dojkabacteria bacterium]|nr:hypothetical protein [Candidatus Dojkabacteria bacterium]
MAVPKQFYFTDFRPTIVKRYVPINTNPYAFVRNRRAAENYFKKKTLRKLSASEFSLLCQKTFANSDFDTCLILILESCASSLAVMPGGLAICLESISDIIIKDKSKSIKPIKDKELAKKIIDECIEVINSHKRELDLNGVETLIKKLQQLNQPTNKDRLRTPFEILGIELLPEDIKVLQARNDLLHGRFPKF